MKRITVLLLSCLAVLTASPQTVSRDYKSKPLAKVLIDLRKSTSQYKIAFIHNELEDYKVTKRFDRLSVPEAIRECIGFYPISMKVEGDSLIFVEAMLKTELKLIGRIIDKGKRPIAYANITLLNVGDTTTVSSGVSNENGDFVIPTTRQHLQIRISCVGYDTQVLNCETGNIGNIVMQETTAHLGEVVVEGDLHHSKPDRDVYIPNQRQRNAANGGIGLLDNLMIPQLDVNRISGEVKSLTNKGITFAIDERIVDKDEIDQIRPKDVLRVEYIDMPTGKFADKEVVINFVMRHYDYGGYVEVKDHSRFLHVIGMNSLQASLDHKKMNYTLLVGNGYKNERGAVDENEEDLLTDKQFHKSTVSQYDHIKEWRNYGVFRTRYRTEKLALTGEVGITQDRTPDYGYNEDLTYSGDITANNTAKSTTGEKNTTTYVNTVADWDITDRQRLFYETKLSFGRNRYDNTYQESDGYDIASHTKEKTFGVYGTIGYVNNLNPRNSLSLRVMEFYHHYDDEYRGTLPRGAITAKYQMDKHNSLESAVYLGNSNPNAAYRSEVEQIVNRYEVLRGNPDLEKTIFSTYYIDYSLMLKNWWLMAHLEYQRLDNLTVSTYIPEGERLVHSYGNDGTLHNLSLNIQQTWFLMNRNLQLKGGILLERNILATQEGSTLSHAHCNLKAIYHIGNCALSAYYESATYGYKGFYAEAGARRLFLKNKTHRFYFDHTHYQYDLKEQRDAYGPWLYMRLSYSFDFGRKSSRQDIEAGSTGSSAILHR